MTILKEELGLLIDVLRCMRVLEKGDESPKILAASARAYEAWCNYAGWE